MGYHPAYPMIALFKRLMPFGTGPLSQTQSKEGFGTFIGVFLPGILTMFGVIVFLRMGWIVGSAGLPITLVVVTLGSLITFITALSIAASSTNIEVKGGGTYCMISRSLGLQMGSAIGVPLLISQLLSVPPAMT
ncbi:MAG: hypothetical protein K940chlam2_00435, partial [Chlamydiae bacterium]|nr:hypothetical protein [Chlamydiota bacterium]